MKVELSRPSNTAALGTARRTGEKKAVLEDSGKGSHIPDSRLENERRRYWGGRL